MSCNVDHLYCCCYDDGGHDGDGGDDADDLWMTTIGVYVVKSGLVMWNVRASETCPCDESGDDFLS